MDYRTVGGLRVPVEEQMGQLRFVLLDSVSDFYGPADAYCPNCGRRVHAGIRQLDDDDPIYYSVCYPCKWTQEVPPDDYHEDFYHYFPEQEEVSP